MPANNQNISSTSTNQPNMNQNKELVGFMKDVVKLKTKDEAGYVLIKSFLSTTSLVESNIKSFDDFIDVRLQEIINELKKEVEKEGDLKIGKIWLGKPEVVEADGSRKQILPIEARLRKLTYSAPLYLEIGLKGGEMQAIEIARLPVMVRSKYCNLNKMSDEELIANGEDPADPGGYFIINGNERALMMIEDLASNQVFVEDTNKGPTLRFFSQRGGYRIPIQIFIEKDGIIQVKFSRFGPVPLVLLVKALGLDKDVDIAKAIGLDNEIVVVNLYEFSSYDKDKALAKLIELLNLSGTEKEIRERLKLRLENNLLPHIGMQTQHRLDKAITLCKLTKQLLIYAKTKEKIDKDHYANKRVRLSGDMLAELLRVHLMIFLRDLTHNIQKLKRKERKISLRAITRSTLLSARIESAIATGSWIGERKGVTQNIDATNYLAKLSQLLRVVSTLSTDQENFEARTLHPTQYGRLCPVETPEGTPIGLRKNLALLARVTTEPRFDEKSLLNNLKQFGLQLEIGYLEEGHYDVMLNGKFIGIVKQPEEFVKAVRQARRQGKIYRDLSIRLNDKVQCIEIRTDAGRVVRPLIIVENGQPKLTDDVLEKVKTNAMTWQQLIEQGIIEYIDANEEENALVALSKEEITPEHTHLEIDPVAMFGLVTALVVYANHEQSARLMRGSKTQKQALGIYAANYLTLLNTDVSVLHYPQKPLVRSFVYDYVKFYPAGQNMIVAIAPYYGYNMEDAIVMNKGSIDRGLARSTYFRPYEAVELKYTGNLKDEICVPSKDVKGYRAEKYYRHLEEDGIVYVEAELDENDVVVGKVSPPKFLLEMEELSIARAKKENSTTIRQEERGVIDAVFITVDEENNKVVQVRTRDARTPELGDKFSTGHGQKGVIGLIVPEQDMPYTISGIKPDIIFNPHGIPSRMTVSYLIELLAGKVAANKAEIIDGTAFHGQSLEELKQQLLELGFRPDGKEMMIDPITGKCFEALIFIGSMYYLKLKYMVGNKIHARATGKVTMLTRQPVEGRAKGGALRLGEMEKDCLVAHGASLLLKERFSSDNVVLHICPKCGAIGYIDRLRNREVCPVCGQTKLEPVEISYAAKLLFEELMSMHINASFKLKNKYEQ